MGDRLQGRVAIVTAAGSGIGRAIAKRFAAEGAHVVVNDRDAAAAEGVAREIGGRATTFVADVSSSERVTAMIQETAARHGRLDVLVNNAAAPAFGRVEEMPDELWRAVFAVTLDATFFGLRAAIPVMAAQGRGSIINTSSAAGLNGTPNLGAYGTAKAAVIALTKTAAIEAAGRGIRINTICPGSIDTPPLAAFVDSLPGGRAGFAKAIPARRIGSPEEIANVALFLASDESSYVTGAVLVADGGVAAMLGPAPDE
jgi:meso-butanediol dehydrogenase/(S,S)-butanediol dehydrogenase/diacetyl reductase